MFGWLFGRNQEEDNEQQLAKLNQALEGLIEVFRDTQEFLESRDNNDDEDDE